MRGVVVFRAPPILDRTFIGDTELARFRFDTDAEAEVEVKAKITAHVAFDESVCADVPGVERLDVTTVIASIGEEVLSLMRALRLVGMMRIGTA